MRLATRNFGEIEYEAGMVIDFVEGIPGFSDLKRFILITDEEHEPFCWLQAVDDPDIAFTMLRIYDVLPDYNPVIVSEEAENLGELQGETLLIYNIVVIPKDIKQMRVNLRAPVVINLNTKKGKQVILNNDEYSIRYSIYNDINQMGNR